MRSNILRIVLLGTIAISNNAIANNYNIVNNTTIQNNVTNNITNSVTVYNNSITNNITIKPNVIVKAPLQRDDSYYRELMERLNNRPTITKLPKPVDVLKEIPYTVLDKPIPQRMDLSQYKQCKHITIEENVIGDSIGHGVRLANGLKGNTTIGIGIDKLIGIVRYIPKQEHGSKDCIYRVTYVSIGTNDYIYRYSASKYNDKLITLESAISSTINPNRIVYLINSNSRVAIKNGTRGVIEALQKGRQFIMLPEHSKEPDTIHYTHYGYKSIYKESINNYLNSVDIKNR